MVSPALWCGNHKETHQISNSDAAKLIGQSGSTVLALQTDTNTRVSVSARAGNADRTFTITGSLEACAKAMKMIQALLKINRRCTWSDELRNEPAKAAEISPTHDEPQPEPVLLVFGPQHSPTQLDTAQPKWARLSRSPKKTQLNQYPA